MSRGRARATEHQEEPAVRGRARNRKSQAEQAHGCASDSCAPARSCGRPRDPAVDQAIIDSATELLATEGFEGMSIEAVAHRAGVGKPAIYRRWPSKRDLVIEILERVADRPEMPEEGTVRQRLTAFMEDWCRGMKTGKSMQSFSSLLGEIHRDPELGEAVTQAFVTTRRRKMLAVLREGIASGEIPGGSDPEMIVDMLFGAIFIRKLMTGRQITPAFGRKIVDMVFSGCCGQR